MPENGDGFSMKEVNEQAETRLFSQATIPLQRIGSFYLNTNLPNE